MSLKVVDLPQPEGPNSTKKSCSSMAKLIFFTASIFFWYFFLIVDLMKSPQIKSKFKFSDYQKSDRDFAFVVDKNFKAQDLIEIISSIDQSLIKSVKIFDVYDGKNISHGKKSIAFRVSWGSNKKTLSEEEINKEASLIISGMQKKLGAILR